MFDLNQNGLDELILMFTWFHLSKRKNNLMVRLVQYVRFVTLVSSFNPSWVYLTDRTQDPFQMLFVLLAVVVPISIAGSVQPEQVHLSTQGNFTSMAVTWITKHHCEFYSFQLQNVKYCIDQILGEHIFWLSLQIFFHYVPKFYCVHLARVWNHKVAEVEHASPFQDSHPLWSSG